MKNLIIFIIFILLLSCNKKNDINAEKEILNSILPSKKVFFLNSYHQGYEWSDGIERGTQNIFSSYPQIKISYYHMDTKRNNTEEQIKKATEEAKYLIDSINPDLIITSDDNAAKYVIKPYYNNGSIPVIFTGVNWDASSYGFPSSNVTGMIEVQLIDQIIKTLKLYAKGNRIAFLKGKDNSAIKEAEFFEKSFDIKLDKRFVTSFNEWVKTYKALQNEADMILLGNTASIPDWDSSEAKVIINHESLIPTGNWDAWMAQYSLITYATDPEEQGEWAAQRALEIFNGTAPSDIPLVKNKKAKIYVNMELAKKLKIIFPVEFLEISNLVSTSKTRIAFINSYHRGYKWSDEIEQGFLKGLNISQRNHEYILSTKTFDLRFWYLDSKRNPDTVFIKTRVNQVQTELKKWNPDILIASDDNASKWLIAPYYKRSNVPVLFCGLNWDASVYGFPTQNITGIIEVAPAKEMVAFLKKYAKGDRLGYLAADLLSERKELNYLKNKLNISFSNGAIVNNVTDWKKEFLELQKSCDMLFIFTPTGITGWNIDTMKHFTLVNSLIPSGSTSPNAKEYSMITFARIPQEQGIWVGKKALAILEGTDISSIRMTENKEKCYYVNSKLLKKLNIKLPASIIDSAFIVGRNLIE